MKHFFCIAFVIVLSIGSFTLTGCGGELGALGGAIWSGIAQNMQPSNPPDDRPYHEKFNWKPEDYFNDPLVIELCRAIEKQDLALMDKLIAEGADANALGEGNMTLLLWAASVGNVDVFAKILEAGADPNIQFESTFGTEEPKRYEPDYSHINLGETILQQVIRMQVGLSFLNEVKRDQLSSTDIVRKIRLLADTGADLNPVLKDGNTPLTLAVRPVVGRFGLAIALIDAGADWQVELVDGATFVQVLVQSGKRFDEFPGTKKGHDYASYQELMSILRQEKGRDFEEELEYAMLRETDFWRINRDLIPQIKAEIAQKAKERKKRTN